MSEHLPHPPVTGTCMGCGVYPCRCYGFQQSPMVTLSPHWYEPPNYTDHMERIARALERIADALEGEP